MLVKQEFKVNGEVKKTRESDAAPSIVLPPFERLQAAGQKLHELIHTEPFPSMDEVFADPELNAQVEQAARDAEIGGPQRSKRWITSVTCKDQKGESSPQSHRDEQEVFLGDEEEIPPAEAVNEYEPPRDDGEVPEVNARLTREYLLTRARIITNGAEYVEDLSDNELADLCAMSRKRFKSFQEWVSLRYPGE